MKAGVKKNLMIAGMRVPTRPLDVKFCERWLVHKDHKLAGLQCGMSKASVKNNTTHRKLKQFLPWLSMQMEKREEKVADKFAIKQEDIIEEMKNIAFANVQDYILQREVKDEATGKITTISERKPVMELTRGQAAALSKVTFNPDGTVTYELPDEKSKHPYLKDLGQHLGLFHPKLIQEHRHAHMHAAIDLRDVDTAKLAEFESTLVAALGQQQGKRILGILDDVEYQDVTEK